jgi:ABC-type oligopeptide transport system substrate-binding subunit
MRRVAATIGSLGVLVAVLLGTGSGRVSAVDKNEARFLVGTPGTFDPAAAGDVATAAVVAQLSETLTTYDASRVLQPALAASWDVAADGRSVTFHLRPDLRFSDGASLTAEDVVGSWLRIIDPAAPAPLASLMLDVKGARDHLAGRETDPSLVGLRANGRDEVEVQLERPGADFPAIVSSPLFGVVRRVVWHDHQDFFGPDAPGSGAYTVASASDTEIVLEANNLYWAGPPAIETVHLLLDIGGKNPISEFEAGNLDYTEVSLIDAPWLPYDRSFGAQLRATPSLSLTYLGFNTRTKPFDDVRIRQAIGAAVDWERVVGLGSLTGQVAARSMVPAGIPGAGDANWLPAHDPDAARRLLAEAGYPGGAGLPTIRFAAGLLDIADGIAADLERELGMHVEIEILDDHLGEIATNAPGMWVTGWIADYIGPNDFLGVLLESDSSNNYGRWVSASFDQAVADALSSRDPATAQAAYERALAEIQRDVPVIPLYGSTDFALSRDGLLGAGGNGLGIPRMAGMAWAP